MHIRGPRERLLNSVLPHEITHTVFAYYFRQPVPRWADEGGSVLSEDDIERNNHDRMCRQILNQGKAMRLSYLFTLMDYPREVLVLYAEGFSVSRYLVEHSDRQTFLHFVNEGLNYHDWNSASQKYYGVNVNQLEANWIDYLKKTPATGAIVVANTKSMTSANGGGEMTGRKVVRSSDPPGYPDLSQTVRGSGAVLGNPGDSFGSHAPNRQTTPTAAPPVELPPPPPLPLQMQSPPARLGTPSLSRPLQ
jgi:hypothetical protein